MMITNFSHDPSLNLGYNLINTPHLRPAAALDHSLIMFSTTIEEFTGLRTISSESDLKIVIAAIKDRLLPQLKLWEFFAIPVEPNISLFQQQLSSGLGDKDVSLNLLTVLFRNKTVTVRLFCFVLFCFSAISFKETTQASLIISLTLERRVSSSKRVWSMTEVERGLISRWH
jgi:hypothetical protein